MADQFSQILALLQQQNAKLEDLGTRMTELERQAQAAYSSCTSTEVNMSRRDMGFGAFRTNVTFKCQLSFS